MSGPHNSSLSKLFQSTNASHDFRQRQTGEKCDDLVEMPEFFLIYAAAIAGLRCWRSEEIIYISSCCFFTAYVRASAFVLFRLFLMMKENSTSLSAWAIRTSIWEVEASMEAIAREAIWKQVWKKGAERKQTVHNCLSETKLEPKWQASFWHLYHIGNTFLALHKLRTKINISRHIPISTHKPVRIYPAWSYLPPPEFHTWKRSSRQARRCHRGSRRDRHWNLDRLEPWLDTGGKTNALVYVYMQVSKNRGTPKSSFLVRISAKSIQHHSAPAIGV